MSSTKWMNSLSKLFSIGKSKVSRKFVGEDHLGNKYYEEIRPNHSYRKTQRYFETKGIDTQNPSVVVDRAHVPPAWDAWLRFRKSDPPSKEELNQSEEYFRYQQSLAAQKKSKEEAESEILKDDSVYQDKKKLPKSKRDTINYDK